MNVSVGTGQTVQKFMSGSLPRKGVQIRPIIPSAAAVKTARKRNLTAQNNTAASRKTGSQEYGKTECNYTNKNYAELIKSYPFIYPSRKRIYSGQSVIRPAKPVTNKQRRLAASLSAQVPHLCHKCRLSGVYPGNLTHSSGALPRARGGYPTVRPPSRPGACCATAREPSLRGGGRTPADKWPPEITLASRAARTSSGRSIKSSRGV